MSLGSRVAHSLMVRDVEASVAFYRDVPGFEVCGGHEDEGGLAWAEVRQAEVVLQLMPGPLCRLPGAPGFTGTLYFLPESVAAVERRIAGRAEIAWGPKAMVANRTCVAERALRSCR